MQSRPLWLGEGDGCGDGLGWLVPGDGLGFGDGPGADVELCPGAGAVLCAVVVAWPGPGDPPWPGGPGAGCGPAARPCGCVRELPVECVLWPAGGATAAWAGSWPAPTWPGCAGRTAITTSAATRANAAAAAQATGCTRTTRPSWRSRLRPPASIAAGTGSSAPRQPARRLARSATRTAAR